MNSHLLKSTAVIALCLGSVTAHAETSTAMGATSPLGTSQTQQRTGQSGQSGQSQDLNQTGSQGGTQGGATSRNSPSYDQSQTQPGSQQSSPDSHDTHMSGMGNSKMQMSGDVDRDFAVMMKMHHQKALEMAQAQLKQGKSPELKAMAKKIIDAQQKEIAQFDKWLAMKQ